MNIMQMNFRLPFVLTQLYFDSQAQSVFVFYFVDSQSLETKLINSMQTKHYCISRSWFEEFMFHDLV